MYIALHCRPKGSCHVRSCLRLPNDLNVHCVGYTHSLIRSCPFALTARPNICLLIVIFWRKQLYWLKPDPQCDKELLRGMYGACIANLWDTAIVTDCSVYTFLLLTNHVARFGSFGYNSGHTEHLYRWWLVWCEYITSSSTVRKSHHRIFEQPTNDCEELLELSWNSISSATPYTGTGCMRNVACSLQAFDYNNINSFCIRLI